MTDRDGDTCPRLRPHVRRQVTRRGLLLYDPAADVTWEGNVTAGEIVALLDGRRTCRRIARDLARRYALPDGQAMADLREFLRAAERSGLVEYR